MDTPSKKQILRYAQDDNFNSGVFMKHALTKDDLAKLRKSFLTDQQTIDLS